MTGGRSGRPRTLLEILISEREQTYEEITAEFERVGRETGEHGASLSVRHLRRLASGERSGTTPIRRRVLRQMFGRPVEELLAPNGAAPARQAAVDDSAEVRTEKGVLAVAADRARRFGLAAGRISLTDELLEQLVDDVGYLATAYPQRPLSEILGALVGTQEAVFGVLEQRLRPAHARQMYFLASVLSGLLAKVSHDHADPHAAMTHARTGAVCADHAEHDGLRAWIRGLESLIAYWAGRPHEAVRHAKSGAEFAATSRSSTIVWLPASEARAWAAMGNATEARAAIERAEAGWDLVRNDDLDELGGICTFGRARQLYYAADALAWLPGEAATAERYAQQAVEAFSNTDDPEWAFGDQAGSHSDLAIARIAARELEGARDALSPVLDLPPEQRINGVVASVQRVHRVISQSVLAADASDLQDEIEAFSSIPMTALTP